MDPAIRTLISTVQQLQLARYLNVSIFMIFVADYFHTLSTEINLLWPAPWTVVKIIYLISRYTPFIDGPASMAISALSPPSLGVCTRLLSIEIWSGGLGQTCSELLLVYRAYALIGRTRLSTILLSLLALAMIVVEFSFGPQMQRGIEPSGANVPSIFPKCDISSASNRIDVATPIVTIIYETILFGTVYWAKEKKYKEDESWLIRKIYRDAVIYYLILAVISATSLIMWFTTSGPISIIPPSLPRYFASIISSRVILNIRQYASVQKTSVETGLTGVGGETTQAVSAIHFAGGNQTISVVDTELRLY